MKSHQISFVSLDLHSLFICTLVQTELIWGKYFQTSYQNLDNSSCNTAVNIIHRTPFHSLDYFGIFLFGSFLSKKKKDCNISKPPMGLVIKKIQHSPSEDKHFTELTSGLVTLTFSRQAVETYEMSYCLCQIWNSSFYLLSVCSSVSKVAIRCFLQVGRGSVNWLFLHRIHLVVICFECYSSSGNRPSVVVG